MGVRINFLGRYLGVELWIMRHIDIQSLFSIHEVLVRGPTTGAKIPRCSSLTAGPMYHRFCFCLIESTDAEPWIRTGHFIDIQMFFLSRYCQTILQSSFTNKLLPAM